MARPPFPPEFDGEDSGIARAEILFRSNILALIGGGAKPRFPKNKLVIWDDFQTLCIADLEFRPEVKCVRLRRDPIVAVLGKSVYVRSEALLVGNECVRPFICRGAPFP